ncbi:hypothetical protein [Noviherbaspirillum saxi]|uniref:Uncharacterized protein n=1 Tax=Noviherbaspirillum saxi TaxID=2320863 RepID=A0A3A3FGZ9_9BURK|nr:hypothetical protein [Noviherbaspirillum saxi]RJF92661.1 hypothetical protein D3871_29205 [Noviherbaspirillum saxi]
MEIAVPRITAVLGFIGGLITPWVKSRVAEREQRNEYRRKQLKAWRDAISDYEVWNNGFGSTPEYSSLRAHMLPDIIVKFEAPRTMYVAGGRGEDVRKHMLLDEVARIEKEWSLL